MILVFVYLPIVQNFYFSFFKMSSYSPTRQFVGLSNYRMIFEDDVFYISLRNNTLYAVISVICQVGFGMLLAIILEGSFIGRKLRVFFRNVYFMPSLLSVTAVGLMFYFIYNPNIGLLNGILERIGMGHLKTAWLGNPKTAIYAVIAMSQWQYTGYIMVLLLVAIQKIPHEQYEAAEIDGASSFKKAIHITIPGIRDMITVCTVITVIGAFKLFTEIYVMTQGGPYNRTQVLGTFMYRAAFAYDEMGYGSAIAVIIFAITFLPLWYRSNSPIREEITR